jgi:transcriptional antiterminator NusG
MRLSDDSWYVVRNTPGVTSFVGDGKQPIPLDDTEVKSILKQMEAEAPRVRVSYQVGQAVKIVDGPFTDFEGVVEAIDHERGRVRALVSIFGRETPMELDFLQVTRLVD